MAPPNVRPVAPRGKRCEVGGTVRGTRTVPPGGRSTRNARVGIPERPILAGIEPSLAEAWVFDMKAFSLLR